MSLFGDGIPSQITLVYYLLACFGFQLVLPLLWDLFMYPFKLKWFKKLFRREKNDWSVSDFLAENQVYMVILNLSDAFFSVVSCVIFVYLAVQVGRIDHANQEEYHAIFTKRWLIWTEFTISLIFFLHFLIRFSTEERKLSRIIHFEWFIDIATAFVGLVAPIIGFYYYNVMFLRAGKIWYITRYFKPWLVKRFTNLGVEIVLLAQVVTVLIFVSAGLFWVLENSAITDESKMETFLFSIYFAVVTLSTVGYGDVTAMTNLGKIAVIIAIACGVVIIPTQASRLIGLITQRLKNGPAKYKGADGHVVALAWNPYSPIDVFLNEFYHKDRGSVRTEICLMLAKNKLPSETQETLAKPFYQKKVTLMQGVSTYRKDLIRTRLEKAECCFLMTHSDKSTIKAKIDSDAKTILACYAIKKYYPNVPIYVQIENEQHKAAVKAAGVKMVICTEQIRIGILAQSCLCPGFSALIGSLIHSYSPSKNDMLGDRQEYMKSLGFELYVTSKVDNFVGRSFHELVVNIYEKFGALLIGIGINKQVKVSQDDRRKHKESGFSIHLNPPLGTIIDQDNFCAILSQNKEEIERIEKTDFSNREVITENRDGRKSAIEMLSYYSEAPKDTHEVTPYEKSFGWTDERMESEDEGSDTETDETNSNGEDGSDLEDENQIKHIKDETKRAKKFIKEDEQVPERTLEEATIDSVQEAGIKRHTLLVGGMVPIIRLIVRVRRYKLKRIRPFVVLSDELPSDILWKTAKCLPQIYFIKGVDTDKRDLLGRADALNARNVIVLHSLSDDRETTTDAKSIMIFRMVKRGKCFPLVDLEYSSNAAFLGVGKHVEEEEKNNNSIDFRNPFYSAGQIYASSFVESLLVQSFYNPYIVRIVEELMRGCVFNVELSNPHLKQFVGKEYKELFHHLLKDGLVPLALRKKSKRMKLREVLTNPSSDVILEEKDVVMILQNSVPEKEDENDAKEEGNERRK
eukprot:TRINITY_DN6266_c0_g1_i1.p1 TRINITY_DN6266_c0_g1~~TRINITY_DN6266_c0_g1_i1.p1  ORF type:complete len:971 (-),score=202.86 TRINITY_DN6266_c0_g1_i1:19-2931(-)